MSALRERHATEVRTSVAGELERSGARLRRAIPDEATARAETLALLQPLRRRLAEEAVAVTGRKAPLPTPPTPERLAELHRVLDEYRAATEVIAFPYVEDPSTVRVDVAMPPVLAAGIDDGRHQRPEYDHRLARAASAGARWTAARTAAQEAVASASPERRLSEALGRLGLSVQAHEALTTLAADMDPAGAAEIVGALSAEERRVVAQALDCPADVDEILVALGLYAGARGEASLRLAQRISADDFDVFMAHNSRDKPAVLGQWQELELRAFISQCVERGTPVIPVLLPDVDALPGSLIFLRELNMVRFHRHFDEVDALERLVWGITNERPAQAV